WCLGDGLGEGMYGTLRRRVVEELLAALNSCDRTSVDDRAARLHVRHCSASHIEVREDVRPERSFELFVAAIFDRILMPLKRRVVDEDVDPTKSVYGRENSGVAKFVISNISWKK